MTGAERSAAWRERRRFEDAARAANAVQMLGERERLQVVEVLARPGMGATRRALVKLESVTRTPATHGEAFGGSKLKNSLENRARPPAPAAPCSSSPRLTRGRNGRSRG